MVKTKFNLIYLASFFFVLAAGRLPASANVSSLEPNVGIVQGTVTDSTGAVIGGATVTLSYFSTKYESSVKTDETGKYRFVNVPFNPYQLKVKAEGFKESVKDVDVHSNAPIQLDRKSTRLNSSK